MVILPMVLKFANQAALPFIRRAGRLFLFFSDAKALLCRTLTEMCQNSILLGKWNICAGVFDTFWHVHISSKI